MGEALQVKETGLNPTNAVGKANRSDNRRLYDIYSNDPNYTDVVFDEKTGGMSATHIGHNYVHNEKDTLRYFGDMTKEDLEKECRDEIVRMGGSIILRDENVRGEDKQIKTALDAVINGKLSDIRSVTSHSETYKNQLQEKNKQLGRWNKENPSNKGRTITLYFHDPKMYSRQKVEDGIKGLRSTHRRGKSVPIFFNTVLVVVRGGDSIIKVRA